MKIRFYWSLFYY